LWTYDEVNFHGDTPYFGVIFTRLPILKLALLLRIASKANSVGDDESNLQFEWSFMVTGNKFHDSMEREEKSEKLTETRIICKNCLESSTYEKKRTKNRYAYKVRRYYEDSIHEKERYRPQGSFTFKNAVTMLNFNGFTVTTKT
jgi:hypothetical protein